MLYTMLGVLAGITGAGSLVFVALQTRIQRTTAELTFNLQIMQQLDAVLIQIADDPVATAYIWSTERSTQAVNDRSHALLQALIDPIELAFTAMRRLPAFRRNSDDWQDYADNVLSESAALSAELEAHPKWWPHLAEYARERARRRP